MAPTTAPPAPVSPEDIVDEWMVEAVAHWTSPIGDDLHEHASEDIANAFEDYADNGEEFINDWDQTITEICTHHTLTRAVVLPLVRAFIVNYCERMMDEYQFE